MPTLSDLHAHAVKVLSELVELKNIHEHHGSTEDYKIRKRFAWEDAREIIQKIQDFRS